MQKLRTFSRTYLKSLTEPEYYRDILKAKFSFSLKYFLVFYTILSLLSTVDFSVNVRPHLSTTAREAIHQLTTNYPNSLVLTIKDGHLQVTGVEAPINVPFPDYLNDPSLTDHFDYLVTIDSTTNYPTTNSLITLTGTDLYLRRVDGSKQSFPYSDIQDPIIINKNAVELTTSSLQSTIDKLLAVSPALYLVAALVLMPAASLFTLLMYALFLWLTLNLGRQHLSYKKSYQLGLHLITFAETAVVIQALLFPSFAFPQLFSLAFFGASFLVIWSLRSKSFH